MPLSVLSKLGIGKEGVWGDGATSGSPDVLLPTNPPSFTNPFENIVDNALRGVMAADFEVYQGIGSIEGSLEGPFYPEEVGFLVSAIMGSPSSGSVSPYLHVFKPRPTPPTLFVQDNISDLAVYRYTGMRVGEFSMSWNAAEGVLNYSASLQGQKKVLVSGTPIPDDTSGEAFRNCTVEVYIGGSGDGGYTQPAMTTLNGASKLASSISGDNNFIVGEAIEGEITFSREMALVYGGDGQCDPNNSYIGPLSVTAGLTIDFNDVTFYDRYSNHDKDEVVLRWVKGTDHELEIIMPKVSFIEGPFEIDRSGIHVTAAYSMRALYWSAGPSSSDFRGPAQVALKNNRVSY